MLSVPLEVKFCWIICFPQKEYSWDLNVNNLLFKACKFYQVESKQEKENIQNTKKEKTILKNAYIFLSQFLQGLTILFLSFSCNPQLTLLVYLIKLSKDICCERANQHHQHHSDSLAGLNRGEISKLRWTDFG